MNQKPIKYLPATEDAWTEAYRKAKRKPNKNKKGWSKNTPNWVVAKAAKRL